jgi:hypothetical protein
LWGIRKRTPLGFLKKYEIEGKKKVGQIRATRPTSIQKLFISPRIFQGTQQK